MYSYAIQYTMYWDIAIKEKENEDDEEDNVMNAYD